LPESNICFVEGTIIQTDQGEIPIQMITNKNTINNLKVIEVTKTKSMDQELICIEKDCLESNSPNRQTIVSENHKILFKEQLVKAKDLPNINKISYDCEILYNVLLEKNSFMLANNLVCETLDVDNVIGLFYKSNYTIEEKNMIAKILNKNIRNTERYRQISTLLFT
jgi:hypothetical protein